MSTALLYAVYGLAAVLVLGVAAMLLTLILGALRLALRRLRRVDPYEPAAAEAPDLDTAFADARRIVTGRMPTADVDRLVQAYDWHAAEYMMRRTR